MSHAPNSTDSPDDATGPLRDAASSQPKIQMVAGSTLLLDLSLLAGWIVATDWLIFRVGTFLTWAVFLLLAVAVLSCVSTLRRRQTRAGLPASDSTGGQPNSFNRRSSCVLLIGLLIVSLSLKLLWCGSWLQVACGLLALLTFSMVLAGNPPFLPELLGFSLSVIAGGAQRLARFRLGTLNAATGAVKPILGLSIVLPAIVLLAFSTLFVLANPNLATSLTGYLQTGWQAARDLLLSFSPFEFVFWIASGWLMLGLLYPARCRAMKETRLDPSLQLAQVPTTLYAAYRNSLLSLIVLFAIYLVFEFYTLWFRTFPDDFYYAGYAHRGAFWLTAALALATVVMSCLFRDSTVGDPRIRSLKRLAIVWAAANFMLAAAVYNRLSIYIDFNGMTHMRVVGLLGISCVVVGFALVVLKTIRDKSFVWLIHRQLWVPLLAVTSYAVLGPQEDYGHRLSLEHATPWLGLGTGFSQADNHGSPSWTNLQIAEALLAKQLRQRTDVWSTYAADPARRDAAISAFFQYAYQWY